MKKIISLIMALGIALSSVTAFAQREVTILKDGEKLNFDVAPYIVDGFTMVPMRAIFESIGASVTWDQETKTVIAFYDVNDDVKALVLQVGRNYAYLNNEKVEFKKSAEIVNDRTFVPLRAVNETLGYKVDWDQDTYTVTITTK
ncbi:MAG: copper amine oxidase N-terminal domain-containing protein [Clostridia bacterium]|nr:copper amine oxidase N-terminal domain-containing protein [Clostridia bacterium]